MDNRFVFPSRGFCIVIQKVAETDFFLDKMKHGASADCFKYYFSAFLSAARSITFSVQAVMSKYPGFENWYPSRQDRLKNSELAKFFVLLRNHCQKVGDLPMFQHAEHKEDGWEHVAYLVPNQDFPEVPEDDLALLSHSYFCLILDILHELHKDFDVYVDAKTIFTKIGLQKIGWTIDDLEESLGFPRGWTDVDFNEGDNDQNRLDALYRYYGDDEMLCYFNKYGVCGNGSHNPGLKLTKMDRFGEHSSLTSIMNAIGAAIQKKKTHINKKI